VLAIAEIDLSITALPVISPPVLALEQDEDYPLAGWFRRGQSGANSPCWVHPTPYC